MWQKPIKKTIYTLNVDNYAPEITKLTYPFMRYYAHKIGAEFHIINKRKFPNMPPVYEKLQILELAQIMQNDWNIYIDSDALVHPETVDFTALLHKDTVLHNGSDMALVRWNYDNVFMRDGRNIGSCNWFTIASDWCLDLWQPLDMPFVQALKNINPTAEELRCGITKEHLIDDYTLSRNIAKYGLKFKTATQVLQENGLPEANFFYHVYTEPIPQKVKMIKKIIKEWKVNI